MNTQQNIDWLLERGISILYQVCPDLLAADKKNRQTRMATEGRDAKMPLKRNPDGYWRDRCSVYKPVTGNANRFIINR